MGTFAFVVSDLALYEVLTGAYRFRDELLAEAYETFLRSPGVTITPVTRDLLR
jgi:hypothetical protein